MSIKTTVLYVDDESINLELFEILFEDKYNVITAESGAEGLVKLKRNDNVAVVISDMKMPVMNGLEFIRIARTEFPDIIYIILTGYDITKEIINALESSIIQKYLCKPFNIDSIRQTLNEAVGCNSKEN
jgi:CheY-like chemotaxis protein